MKSRDRHGRIRQRHGLAMTEYALLVFVFGGSIEGGFVPFLKERLLHLVRNDWLKTTFL
ncbi:MAG: hypothetical protein KBG49_13565 [Spirochaetes bacterium]|nr:hypothetical protein [Spirochaetota bacterium]